jgi:transposase
MNFDLLTELLGLSEYFVKQYTNENNVIVLDVERKGFPECPKCGKEYIDAPKDSRNQKVEDLSVFGKRCFLRVEKFRIDCSCGYSGTEHIKWLNRYERVTARFQKWTYAFCKRMTCKDVSIVFGISKHLVYRLDKEGIEKELKMQKPITPSRIGIDEISRKKGHRYATIISAPDERKILEVVKGRKSSDVAPFFKGKGVKWCNRITSVSMDAWLAFRKVVKKHCKNAAIAFDHFHLTQHFSKAIDTIRIQESRNAQLKHKGIYKGTRWLMLCNPKKLNEDQKGSLDSLLKLNGKLMKAYILRERFREIYKGLSSHSRLIRLSIWIAEAKSAKIGSLTDFVKKILKWEPYIRNALRGNHSNAFAEGLNNKVRVIQRMAYGYKDFEYLRLKIIQQFNFKDVRSLFD